MAVENKEQEEPKEQETPAPLNKIDEANKAADRMEAANKKHEELVEREEQAKADRILGGQADAGEIPVIKTEDEKLTDEANAMLEGSGMSI